ncbi:MAG: hypothetical protein KatS3mg131_2481 [Candidatus Tectimicrobiota bacterium]|nr:MAG: hypothetical protein KatS3mg131_2481 [Candidatus Tectomicrobia bacterium]
MQSTGAAYMGTGGAILMRDFYVRVLRPSAGHAEQVWVGRLLVFVVVAVAMIVALTSRRALVMLGGLAVSFGFLLYLPLLDTLYLRKFTRQGVALGLLAGILAVIFTFSFPAWKYPLNLHSAGWGGLVAFVVAALVSGVTRGADQQDRRVMEIRREMTGWLDDIDRGSPELQKKRRFWLWAMVVWFVFAIGPGDGRRQPLLLHRRPAAGMDLAGGVVDARPGDDVGASLQGPPVVHHAGADPARLYRAQAGGGRSARPAGCR